VVARPVLPLSITIDHRYVDGAHLGRALHALRGYLEDPALYECSAESS
jgi:pyruvate dehydrogenase E2 component (dihydrolipoamide acetyltransferase)